MEKIIYILTVLTFLFTGKVWAEQKVNTKIQEDKKRLALAVKKTTPKAKPKAAESLAIQQSKISVLNPDAKFYGMFDLRPAFALNKGTFSSENFAEFGYKFNKNISLGYQQQFTHSSAGNDFSPALGDGLLRFSANNVLVDSNSGFKFHYEARAYAPTNNSMYQRGFITAIRNYFILEKAFNDNFSLLLIDVPILYAFDKDSVITPNGAEANVFFENRIFFGPLWVGNQGSFTLFLPIKWSASKFRAATIANAINSDEWGARLWFDPEILVSVGKGVKIGFEFETGSFLDANMNFDFENAFRTGLAKFVFQINF